MIPIIPLHLISILSSASIFAGMVTHPAPGNYTGTLVNGILFHLGLGSVTLQSREDHDDGKEESINDDDMVSEEGLQLIEGGPGELVIRPGIVHRLDKGTTGVMVVAKTGRAKVISPIPNVIFFSPFQPKKNVP